MKGTRGTRGRIDEILINHPTTQSGTSRPPPHPGGKGPAWAIRALVVKPAAGARWRGRSWKRPPGRRPVRGPTVLGVPGVRPMKPNNSNESIMDEIVENDSYRVQVAGVVA